VTILPEQKYFILLEFYFDGLPPPQTRTVYYRFCVKDLHYLWRTIIEHRYYSDWY